MRDPISVKQYTCDYDARVAVWLVRLCLSQDVFFRQIAEGENAESIRELLGITLTNKSSPREAIRAQLKQRAATFNKKPHEGLSELFVNTQLLAHILQLNEVEQRVVEFAALSSHHRLLRVVMATVVLNRTAELISMLASVHECCESDIQAALDRNGVLIKTALLSFQRNDYHSGITVAASERLTEILHLPHRDANDLVRQFVEPVGAATLSAKDYPHLASEIEVITQYLASVIESQAVGVNILIYGIPGVGKTELVRLLAQRVAKPLFQVKSSEDNAGALSGFARLMSYSLSQRILLKTNALILFDEMEDVFSGAAGLTDRLRYGQYGAVSKAWLNEILEKNPVPTIWISNAVHHIDPAFLRRFDMSFEIGVPPVKIRQKIIKKYLNGMRIAPAALEQYANHDELTPAQIEKAAKVARSVVEQGGDGNAAFQRVLGSSMALLQQTAVTPKLDLGDAHYRLDFLSADCDVLRLVDKLKQAKNPRGAICFYGAPGTGKTALAHHIAQATGHPLLVRRASDILSMYVGGSEKNIAEMFAQAEQDKAILLLDEADSFLADRRDAKQSWEVTQVNELLTQMEVFTGLFICSTNLMARLDEASLRRFALKIKFEYLKPEQRWLLFREHIGRRVRVDETHCRAKLNQLNNLTPGDFACIRRQSALLDEKLSADRWLFHLERECRSKPDSGGRSIGFR